MSKTLIKVFKYGIMHYKEVNYGLRKYKNKIKENEKIAKKL